MRSRRRDAVCEWSRDPCDDRAETIVNLPVKRTGEGGGTVQGHPPRVAMDYFNEFTCATN